MRAALPRPRRLVGLAAATGLLVLAGTGLAKDAPRKPVSRLAEDLPYRLLPIDERVTRQGRIAGELVMVPAGEQGQEGEMAEAVARTHGEQRYRPRPALWRIGDQDTTIYIFGTIHSLPPGFRWRTARLDAVVAKADRLLLESTEGSPGDADPLLMGDMAPGAPDLPPLAERLPAGKRGLLKTFQSSLPPKAAALLDGMPTWVAAMAIGFVRDLRAGNRPGPGADDWLEAHFREARKPVEAIENSSKVVANVNAVPEERQRQMLVAALEAPARTGADLAAPAHAWARGDLGPKSALVRELEGPDGPTVLRDPLLTKRNQAWADSLAARLGTPGTLLFAAGAGHFLGKGSVLELLRQRGIKVTRVE